MGDSEDAAWEVGPPRKFTESELTFNSITGAVSLAGTLTLPEGGKDCPAAVLVSGTGPVDRDVTFQGHTLFRVLAHGLARSGIASLRFDKRGVGESGGDFNSAGPEDFAADVLGALAHLVDGERFRSDRTGMVGHSEGGMVALTAALTANDVPFSVLLASPLVSGTKNLVHSFALLGGGSFEHDSRFTHIASALGRIFSFIHRNEKSDEDRALALELADRIAPQIFNDSTASVLGTDRMSGEGLLELLASPCLETCLSWEPEKIAPRVECPVLAIYAQLDTQAPADPNLGAAYMIRHRHDKAHWEIRLRRNMNHAFQICERGTPDEYATAGEVMAGNLPAEVAAWIKGVVGTG